MRDLKALIRNIPGFPKAGIVFRDITPLLANGPAWHETVNRIAERYRGRVDVVLGVESRGVWDSGGPQARQAAGRDFQRELCA